MATKKESVFKTVKAFPFGEITLREGHRPSWDPFAGIDLTQLDPGSSQHSLSEYFPIGPVEDKNRLYLDPWGPAGAPKFDIGKKAPPAQHFNFEDPNSIGAMRLLQRAATFGANIPEKLQGLENPAKGYDWGLRYAPVIGPVYTNARDFLTQTEAEYKTRTAKRTTPTTAPAAKTPFSFTGEYANLPQYVSSRESGGNPNAKNPNSSATGEFQFIDQTWLGLVKKYGPQMRLSQYPQYIQQDKNGKYYISDPKIRQAALDFRKDPDIARRGFEMLSAENHAAMQNSLGRQPTQEEMYLAWHFNPGVASALAKAPPNANAAIIVGTDAVKANPAIFPRGAQTTVAEVRSKLAGVGQRAQGRTILATTTELPGPPPNEQPMVPRDFSVAEAMLAAMKPDGVDEAYVKKMQRNALLSGWASGLASTEGGIPGMLARMAGGAFQGKMRGDEFAHAQQEDAKKELLAWQNQNLNFELKKGDQRWEEANANRKTGFSNASRQWEYKTQIAQLGKVDMDGNGVARVTTVGPDGKSITHQLVDVGTELSVFRQANGIGGFGRGGGSASGMIPKNVEDAMKQYQWAQMRQASGMAGGDAGFAAALAAEINDSPYKMELLGGDPKQHLQAVTQIAARSGDGNMDRAWITYIAGMIGQKARKHPEQMNGWMGQLAGRNLIGPYMMREQ